MNYMFELESYTKDNNSYLNAALSNIPEIKFSLTQSVKYTNILAVSSSLSLGDVQAKLNESLNKIGVNAKYIRGDSEVITQHKSNFIDTKYNK